MAKRSEPRQDYSDRASDSTERFVQLIAKNQNRVYAYVYSMLGNHTQTGDVLQETNLVLWRKRSEFEASRPFLPWALAIARFQVMAYLRDQSREKVLLDVDLAETIADEVETQGEVNDSRQWALRKCLETLPVESRDLVQRRYFQSATIEELSRSTKRGVSSVKVVLLRIRRKLADCIERRVAEAG